MPKPWYSIKAAAEGSDVAEISILEDIHPWYGCNAKSYLAEFRALQGDKVKMFLNTPGGSVTEALAMSNGMRATGKKIEAHVLGIAASAGAFLAISADRCVMPANTFMFLHDPETGVHGNADELRDVAGDLDKIGDSLMAVYAKRWKGTPEALEQLLKDEPLLTAAECLEYGFCDEVIDGPEVTASFDLDMLPPAARKVFDAVTAKKPAPEPAPAPAADPAFADVIAAAAKAAGLEKYTAIFVTDPEASTPQKATALIERARNVVALATHAGLADRAEALIRGRKSMDEVRAELCAELSEADIKNRVDTARRSGPAPGDAAAAADVNPTSLWAAHLAAKKG